MLLALLAAATLYAPDPALTPGAVDHRLTTHALCRPGYTAEPGVRHVIPSVKVKVFHEYHIDPATSQFEVDHLVALELGGSNSIKNLWPQDYKSEPWNAHDKDALEDRLHALVCRGELPLATAQHDVATDWIAAYLKYVKGMNIGH